MRSLDDLPGVAPGNLLVGLAEDSCTGAYYSRDDTKYRDPFQELHNKELCKPENSMALGTQRCAAGLCNLKTKTSSPSRATGSTVVWPCGARKALPGYIHWLNVCNVGPTRRGGRGK